MGQPEPSPNGERAKREPSPQAASIRRPGARSWAVRSTHVNRRRTVVTENRPKILTGLDQKVRGQVPVLLTHRPQMPRPRSRGQT
jgi:hypothetical protein